jgi:5,10-methylenetetrahydrofolate reductase
MEKKVEAGAQFFQTQAVYEPAAFESFMKRVENLRVPVLVGIVLLKSAGMAKFMNENVAGVRVPEDLIKRMAAASKEDRPKVSVEIAAQIIRAVKGMCQGAHIMPLGWDKYVPGVIEAAGLA